MKKLIQKRESINNFNKEIKSDFFRRKMIDRGDINNHIYNLIKYEKKFMIGRCGRVEGNVVNKCLFEKNIDLNHMKHGRLHSGITPLEKEVFNKFSNIYFEANKSIDLVGLVADFENQTEFAYKSNNSNYTMLPHISPIKSIIDGVTKFDGCEELWPKALAEKKILVIHPFIESITHQYRRKDKIKTISKLLPNFEIDGIIPPQTSADNHGQSNWLDEFEKLKNIVRNKDFDIALIGAGSYGLPIGAFIKEKLNKGAIFMGGDVQVLFGVIGRRWEKEYYSNNIVDETWIRHQKHEIPPSGLKVESGYYY